MLKDPVISRGGLCVMIGTPLAQWRVQLTRHARGQREENARSTIMKNAIWFLGGITVGLSMLTFAKGAVRPHSEVRNDTALYQNLSEIRVKRVAEIRSDDEIARLAQLERRYTGSSLHEHPRVKPVLERISNRKQKLKEDRELDSL